MKERANERMIEREQKGRIFKKKGNIRNEKRKTDRLERGRRLLEQTVKEKLQRGKG